MEGEAEVDGPSRIYGRACVKGTASMYGSSTIYDDAVLEGTMFGYTALAGDSFVGEGVLLLPVARVLDDGRIETNTHYFCGWGGAMQGPWTFYRGKRSKVWLTVAATARPAEDWYESCEQAGAEPLPGLRTTGDDVRALLDHGLSLPVVGDW